MDAKESKESKEIRPKGYCFVVQDDGTVAVEPNKPELIEQKGSVVIESKISSLLSEVTSYGAVWPKKDFAKNEVLPAYVVDEATKKRYKVTRIKPSCFDGARCMETLSIPDTILSMEWCFWECDRLKEIHVDPKNEKYCDVQGVVFSKEKKSLLFFPPAYPAVEYRVPDTTRKIENKAFKTARNLKTLYLPASVVSIGINAFYRCSALEHVYIEGKLIAFGGHTEESDAPKAIFYYQGKEWKSEELKKEFEKKKQ